MNITKGLKKQIYHSETSYPDYEKTLALLEEAEQQGAIVDSGSIQFGHMRKEQKLRQQEHNLHELIEDMGLYIKPGIHQPGEQYKPYIITFEATHTVIDAKRSIEHYVDIKTTCFGGNGESKGTLNDKINIAYHIAR